MDVNKPERVYAVGDQPHRPPAERHHDAPQEDDDDQARRERHESWSADAAVDLAGTLSGQLTPESQEVLNAFAAQMEPLRAELETARRQAAHFHELAVEHDFLPVPNRREFLRELSHVIAHMDSLQPPPALMVVHLMNAGDIRRRMGRRACDEALCLAAQALEGAIHPTDAVGSLCGDDFGVILLNGTGETARRRAQEISDHLIGVSFDWMGVALPLTAAVGCVEIKDAWSAVQAVEAADADLRENLR